MEFGESGALERLQSMTAEELDALPFGVVGMTADGTVKVYNRPESELAGLAADTVMGHNFFAEVAPCTNNFMVGQRFLDEPGLDEQLPYVLTVRMRPTKVKLRMLKSQHHDLMYLLIDRES